MKYYLAIDIGASSGRHIVGWLEDGQVKTEEVYRFPNQMDEADGHLIWDMDRLEREVRAGIDIALREYPDLVCLSIDTWGVDYVLMRRNEPVRPCYAYRDNRTEPVIPEVHAHIPFAELYAHTGIQFQPFNTIYQLYADKLAGRLDGVTDFLMVPEYLMYRLTGVKTHEYTNATTGGLVNAFTMQFDRGIIEKLGLPLNLFASLSMPGSVVGQYRRMAVLLCPTHDTAAAVEGIPMPEEDGLFLSSGTWSLLGAKLAKPITTPASQAANYTNEGGVGYIRYLKNIMGMWLVNRLRDELCPEKPFPDIVSEAENSVFEGTVDANAPCFLAPNSMKAAFDEVLEEKPESVGDYFRCAYRSLALSYRDAIRELEANTGKTYEKLYIVGGGAKNQFLNKLTAQATGKEVAALPIEATALGNLKIQMEAISC